MIAEESQEGFVFMGAHCSGSGEGVQGRGTVEFWNKLRMTRISRMGKGRNGVTEIIHFFGVLNFEAMRAIPNSRFMLDNPRGLWLNAPLC